MRVVAYPKPGEILLEEFLKPMGLTQYRLAKEIGVPQRRIGEIISGKRGITADSGLRLSRFFGLNDAFWVGLQLDHDLAQAHEEMREVLDRIRTFAPLHADLPKAKIPRGPVAKAVSSRRSTVRC
jgi:addiction module HigA family antidote